jgi:hypothetical protein
MALLFNMPHKRTGDIMIAMPAVKAAKEAGFSVKLASLPKFHDPIASLISTPLATTTRGCIKVVPDVLCSEHHGDRWLGGLKKLGIPSEPKRLPAIEGDRDLVLLQPWCEMKQKRFDPVYWVEISRLLTSQDKTVMVGAPAEFWEEAEAISRKVPGVINYAGQDKKSWVETIKKAGIVVTVDSGAGHVADAMGKPTVVLFRITRPQEWAPFWDRSGSLYRPTVDQVLEQVDKRIKA